MKTTIPVGQSDDAEEDPFPLQQSQRSDAEWVEVEPDSETD